MREGGRLPYCKVSAYARAMQCAVLTLCALDAHAVKLCSADTEHDAAFAFCMRNAVPTQGTLLPGLALCAPVQRLCRIRSPGT
eukprot:1392654-Rhodomonas_salina.2